MLNAPGSSNSAQIDAEKDGSSPRGAGTRLPTTRRDTASCAVMQLLHAERTRQGLSLADMQARTGIARSALSRLETDADANPTLTTITRYAEALGKDLQILLIDKARSALSKRTKCGSNKETCSGSKKGTYKPLHRAGAEVCMSPFCCAFCCISDEWEPKSG